MTISALHDVREISPRLPSANPNRPMAPAKLRILETADQLFTSEGIRSVGIDRIIAESRVTKATFYKHFGSKERLVVDYTALCHERHVAIVGEQPDPIAKLDAIVEIAVDRIDEFGFRGDRLLNAAAEFPESGSPVRRICRSHQDWLIEVITDALAELGHPHPRDTAAELLLARNGAMAVGYLSDPLEAKIALRRVVDRAIAESAAAKETASAAN